jgi:hypothetical protein
LKQQCKNQAFFPSAQVFWELCRPVSVEVLMHGKPFDTTPGLLGGRALSTLLLQMELVRRALGGDLALSGPPGDLTLFK